MRRPGREHGGASAQGEALARRAPEAAAAEAGLWTRELTEPPLRGRVALAWRADGSPGPAVRILLERLQTALTRVAPDPPRSP